MSQRLGLGITFPAEIDNRNCVYIPSTARDIIGAEAGDYVEISIKVTKKGPKNKSERVADKKEKKRIKNAMDKLEDGAKLASINGDISKAKSDQRTTRSKKQTELVK